ncbi:MAG: hypothetical protein IJ808_00490, partial [Muribaculaceae bacterium]|nr:hypothetical protein [Muribaculaceae bacterium]
VVEQQSGADAALPYYQKCVELAPDNAQGLYNVGRYYYNQAVSAAEQNARLSARTLKNKVNPLYQKAMSYLEKSNEIDSKNEDVRNALRNIYYKLGEGKKLEALEKKGK